MVLNGDILEYEGVGQVTQNGGLNDELATGGLDVEGINLLITFFEFVWANYYPRVESLRGGLNIEQNYAQVHKRYLARRLRQKLRGTMDKTDFYSRARNWMDNDWDTAQDRTNARLFGATAATAAYQFANWKKIGLDKRRQRGYKQSEGMLNDPDTLMPDMPTWMFREEQQPETHTTVNINNMAGGRRSGGISMLTWKNSLTRKLRSELIYEMSAVMYTNKINNINYHITTDGQGPLLYHKYDHVLKIGSVRNVEFNTPLNLDQGNRGVGWDNVVYVFAADWPFSTMNHDLQTQDLANATQGKYLSWDYLPIEGTTDRNCPYTGRQIAANTDWTYFTHYYTVLSFDMTNLSHRPHVVEILFFKFKADPDTMDYLRQSAAIMSRQKSHMQEYIQGTSPKPQDINIVKRKRIYLRGMDNRVIRSSTLAGAAKEYSGPSQMRENSFVYKYVVKRKYVIKRPVLTSYDTELTEDNFFNTYYEPDKGVYCRVCAFPLEADFLVNENTNPCSPVILDTEDAANEVENAACTTLGFGVNVFMSKSSRFKLDENRLVARTSG